MTRVLIVSLIALTASACAYRPSATDMVQIMDSPADVRACTRLAEVSPTITTTPGFGPATQSMLEATVALGGTHLLLDKRSEDWLLVRGIAYRCGPGAAPERVVIRAKG
jgi:hypothetical protein